MSSYAVAAKFQQNIDILMILKKVLKLDNILMPKGLMNKNLRLQFFLCLSLRQRLLVYYLSSIMLSCLLRY